MNRFRFLASLLVEHSGYYLVGGALTGLTLWMTVAIPRFLQQAIDILRSDPDPADSGFLNRIGWILAFAVAIMVTRTGSRLFFFIPGRKVEFKLKNRLLEHLSTLQREFFLANPTGSIISRINNDINGIRMMMGLGLMMVVSSGAMLSLAPYEMYKIAPTLTLYITLPILVAFFLLRLAIRRLRGLQLAQMKALQDLSDFTVESYNGIDVLKTYRARPWAEMKFTGLSDSVKNAAIRMASIRAFFMPLLTHIVNALKVVLVLAGGLMVIEGEMTIGQFMAYALYLTMLLPPLMGMTFMMFVMQRGLTALVSLEAIFNTRPDIPPVVPESIAALPHQLQRGLKVQGLSFAYPDDPEQPKLQKVSFEVRPGEIVGIFGPLGSGKTTLVNLINRYLNTPPGTVTLDGIDITEVGLQQLRHHVVTVTQEPFLFSDSIRENVRFAAADPPEGAVEEALGAAAMREDLARFPAGEETQVGEKGITLSGGQKQRIALARSILKPCDLLILDDVLSAVDHETERFLVDRIYGFQHARSLLIVSHRISVLERADRIVVLEQGRETAVGTHAELIAREGSYRSAYRLQSEREAGPAVPSESGRGQGGAAAGGAESP